MMGYKFKSLVDLDPVSPRKENLIKPESEEGEREREGR